MREKRPTFPGASGVTIREMLRAVISHEVANKFSVLSIYLNWLRKSKAPQAKAQVYQDAVTRLHSSMIAVEAMAKATRDALNSPDVDTKAELDKRNLSREVRKLGGNFSPLRSQSLEKTEREWLETASRTVLNMQRAVDLCQLIVSSSAGEWETLAPTKIERDIRSAVPPLPDDRLTIDLGSSSFYGYRVHVITALSNYVKNAARSAFPNQADHRISVTRTIVQAADLPEFVQATPDQLKDILKSSVADWHVFAVRNNGRSIPVERLGDIWGFGLVLDQSDELRSTTEDDDIEERTSGRGLGLPLVKYAAELHGGGVWVRNNSSGGVTFYFIIPTIELNSKQQ